MPSTTSRRSRARKINAVTPILKTQGFVVADVTGDVVGQVECPLYGTDPDDPDALAVVSGRIYHRHYIVPATVIGAIDRRMQVIDLVVERGQLQRFL